MPRETITFLEQPYNQLNQILEPNNNLNSNLIFNQRELEIIKPRPKTLESIISLQNNNLSNFIRTRDETGISEFLRNTNSSFENEPYITEENLEDLQELIEINRSSLEQYSNFDSILSSLKSYGNDHEQSYFMEQAVIMGGGSDRKGLATALVAFQEGEQDRRFGAEYLAAFQKQGVEMPPEELAKYGLQLDIQKNRSKYGKKFPNKYFDTKFNFCLTYEGNLIASVGFDPELQGMFIWQIQGIRNHRDQLKPIKWERALLNYAFQWAQEQEIPKVSVVSVDNNEWAKRNGHLTPEQGKMLYDVSAKRSGFKQRDNNGNYFRLTSQQKSMPLN